MPGGFERRLKPRGGEYFWSLLESQPAGPEGTDTWALRNGYVSVTPCTFDQTAGWTMAAGAGLEFVEKLKIGN